MNVTLEGRGLDVQRQALVEEFNETVEAVIGAVVAVIDQRIGALDQFDIRLVLLQWCDERVVLPKFRAGCAHICQELAGMAPMQIPHGGRQHDDIAG